MPLNYYEILGVKQSASDDEIKAAFKSLAKKYHPDKNAGNTVFEEHFKIINSAYQTLSDNKKRQRYNLILQYQFEKKKAAAAYNNSTNTNRGKAGNPSEQAKPRNSNQTKNNKYALIIISGFIIFISCALFFYHFMNKRTALDSLESARELEANKQFIQAFNAYSDAIEFNSSLTEAYIGRAKLRLSFFKDKAGALKDFTKAIEQAPAPDYKPSFERAKFYLKQKKYKEGLNDLDEAIKINPSYDSLYFYKAEVNNYILKKHSASVRDYEKVLQLNPHFKDARFGKAIAEQYSGDYQNSLNDFNELVKQFPEEGSYYYYRAFSKINLKDSSGACTDWEKAIYHYFYEAQEEHNKYCKKIK